MRQATHQLDIRTSHRGLKEITADDMSPSLQHALELWQQPVVSHGGQLQPSCQASLVERVGMLI